MKVHFADSHNSFASTDMFHKAGVKYMLQTFYSIHKQKCKLKVPIEDINKFEHVIIDSGMFSMMFGCDAGKKIDATFCKDWMDSYIGFINNTPFRNASFVEMDVQKILGVEAAWELRREMKKRINKGTVINAYHVEDENPDKLIEFSDYVAVSVPELRMLVSTKERYRITRYIVNKALKKGKRVHLLGCTEKKMMKEFSNATSCDSTSWLSGCRYGTLKTSAMGEIKADNIYKNDIQGLEVKRDKYTYISAGLNLIDYKKYAGDQS